MLSLSKLLYRRRENLTSETHEKKKKEMSRLLRLSLDPGDVSKLEVLKKRFIFSEDIDVIRYLLTNAYEEIAAEVIEYQRSVEERNNQNQTREKVEAPTPAAIQ